MDTTALLFHIQRLEQRLHTVEAENTQQAETIRRQDETIKQLQTILQQYCAESAPQN
jgi:hypothetical protein